MSQREEAFRRMLGREPSATERTDMALLREVVRLGDNDPFWGIAAFLYARNPSDTESRERLRLTRAALDAFGRTLEGLVERLPEQVPAGVPDTMASTVATAVGVALANWAPRSSLRTALAEHVHTVLLALAGLIFTVVLAVSAAYWAGIVSVRRVDATQQAALNANAHTLAAWTRTRDGRRVYAWARLNALGLRALLTCSYSGWQRIARNGYALCYPNGSGHGYYLPPG
ncbi:MAG: hypothetical protein ACYDB8_00535 [Acidiferrobacterales bacterium]